MFLVTSGCDPCNQRATDGHQSMPPTASLSLAIGATPVPDGKVVPLELLIDGRGNFYGVDGHKAAEDDIKKQIEGMNDQGSIHIYISVDEGFEDKVSARQLTAAIGQVRQAAKKCGHQINDKTHITLFLPGAN
jgi:hypothetical protein